MENVFQNLSQIFTFQIPKMELRSIYLTKSVMIMDCDEGYKRTKRIKEGDGICVKDGEIVDCNGIPQYVITSCRGRIDSDFEISIISIKTKELSILYL